ncbi:hypothetical protein H4R21_000509 [Coemansia helicoidea]|uniref:Uncharacterized protein n=1 Tax=Coemansia helicoidea TaxID=1286919 RepID=A0ACC1LGZ5_9FUNG|nr:hypothetical protein H4R21_000509 [Coemansia helicoidea]
MAVLRNLQPIQRHTLTMAGNWALFGMLFVTARELLLAEQARKNDDLHLRMSQTRGADEMFSSTVAGALTGGALSFAARRSRIAAASGAVFFAAAAAAGQLAVTRLNRYRQQRIIDSMDVGSRPSGGDKRESWTARLRAAVMVDPVSWLPEWFPIRRISSAEYRSMLTARRRELEAEAAEIRGAVASMDRREQALLRRLQEVS